MNILYAELLPVQLSDTAGTDHRLHVISPDSSTFQCEMSLGLGCHLGIMTSRQKYASINRWRTILPTSSWSDLKWRSLRLFFKSNTSTKTKRRRRTTRWV